MSDDVQELGTLSDLGAIDRLLRLEGLSVIDVGCGAGAISRGLVDRGARVLGVEPDPIQAAKNRAAAPLDGLTFVEGGAEALPAPDASQGGVFFFRSLHHVPGTLMDAALAEAARVLKPDGFLWVVEPAMDGRYFALIRPFHDETAVRIAAQEALARTAAARFGAVQRYRYVEYRAYTEFSAFVGRQLGNTFNSIDAERVQGTDVRALFDAALQPDGRYVFDQPMLLNLYRQPVMA